MTFTTQADRLAELPPIDEEDRQWLSYNPNTSDIVDWIQRYALSAIAAIAKQPDAGATAWEYENEFGNRFLTYSDPNKWREHDKRCFKNFMPLVRQVREQAALPMSDERIEAHFDAFQNDRRILGDHAAFVGTVQDILADAGIKEKP